LLGLAAGLLSRPGITPNDDFFVASINGTPSIDADEWRLRVRGLVDRPLALTLGDIGELPDEALESRLQCVGGPSGNAVWRGAYLSTVLEMAGVSDGAVEAVFKAADGYSSSLTLEEISETGALLAYEMNGEPLPPEQGHPLRLVVPGHYGYKWVKWIVEIELVDYDYEGYWESRGWSDDARRTPQSEWLPHAAALSTGFILLGFAVASGYAGRPGRLSELFPVWMGRRFHIAASAGAMAILAIVFAWWAMETAGRMGMLFYTGHGIMSGILIALLAASGSMALLARRRKWAETAHEYLSLFALVMCGGVIGTGLMASGLF
jgi:hypothetical protein